MSCSISCHHVKKESFVGLTAHFFAKNKPHKVILVVRRILSSENSDNIPLYIIATALDRKYRIV